MKLILETWRQPDCVLGRLIAGEFHCLTLELPDHGNRHDISCIPAGTYNWVKHVSPSNGKCIWIKEVPNRSNIQIHSGNYTRQILGCILVGDSIKFLDDDTIPDVTNSKNTLAKLMHKLPAEGTIEIRRVG
jgi:hypothetical protein